MVKIKNIFAKEIKDSRGNLTLDVSVETDKGIFVAGVPSGASTGKNEALELRDADGKGVSLAINNVNKIIAPKLKGRNSENQKEIDQIMIELDGTENKSKLGANAIVGVSMAVCRAGAGSKKISLYKHIAELSAIKLRNKGYKIPLAMFNILEGGRHAKNNLSIQEFMIVCQKESFNENLILCNKIFLNLKEYVEKISDKKDLMGDEGGFAPEISKTEQALLLLKNSIGNESAKIALDVAASEFFENGKYKIDGNELLRSQMLEFYTYLVARFPIISIEDPFAEDDWNGFEEMEKLMQDKILVVGDDLTTTNIKKIKEAHNKKACNGVILKLNQIGTVWETIEAGNLAKSFNWKTIVSHRSGETMDDFIADLAVGLSADFIKSGSPAKEERMVKYKRLLEIEKELKV
jgi:enolase